MFVSLQERIWPDREGPGSYFPRLQDFERLSSQLRIKAEGRSAAFEQNRCATRLLADNNELKPQGKGKLHHQKPTLSYPGRRTLYEYVSYVHSLISLGLYITCPVRPCFSRYKICYLGSILYQTPCRFAASAFQRPQNCQYWITLQKPWQETALKVYPQVVCPIDVYWTWHPLSVGKSSACNSRS